MCHLDESWFCPAEGRNCSKSFNVIVWTVPAPWMHSTILEFSPHKLAGNTRVMPRLSGCTPSRTTEPLTFVMALFNNVTRSVKLPSTTDAARWRNVCQFGSMAITCLNAQSISKLPACAHSEIIIEVRVNMQRWVWRTAAYSFILLESHYRGKVCGTELEVHYPEFNVIRGLFASLFHYFCPFFSAPCKRYMRIMDTECEYLSDVYKQHRIAYVFQFWYRLCCVVSAQNSRHEPAL